MAQFLLLLHNSPENFADVSPEQIQSVIQEYSAWRDQLEAQQRLAGSNKLTDEGGKWLTGVNGNTRVVDGPYSEAKEVVSGYFLIEADDYESAIEACGDCPHLRYGGRIELRQIDVHD